MDDQALQRYADRLRPESERYSAALGQPVVDDDGWTARGLRNRFLDEYSRGADGIPAGSSPDSTDPVGRPRTR